jgi:hypothetical protein
VSIGQIGQSPCYLLHLRRRAAIVSGRPAHRLAQHANKQRDGACAGHRILHLGLLQGQVHQRARRILAATARVCGLITEQRHQLRQRLRLDDGPLVGRVVGGQVHQGARSLLSRASTLRDRVCMSGGMVQIGSQRLSTGRL